MSKKYLFHSERLGFRNWSENDLAAFAAMNADNAVMKYFPKQLTLDESKELFYRLQRQYQKWR